MKTFTSNSIELLGRMEISELDPELATALSGNPFLYAKENLGYTHPDEEKKYLGSALAKAIHTSGVKPFVSQTVLAYKKERLRQVSEEAWWYYIPEYLLKPVGVLSVVGLFLSLFAGMAGVWFAGLYALVFAIFGTLVIIVSTVREGSSQLKYVEWQKVHLKGYGRPVPEFALATAQEISMRCPGVKFFIDELVERQAVKDPFLVAVFEDQEYYLEVWNEPGYKQERMA